MPSPKQHSPQRFRCPVGQVYQITIMSHRAHFLGIDDAHTHVTQTCRTHGRARKLDVNRVSICRADTMMQKNSQTRACKPTASQCRSTRTLCFNAAYCQSMPITKLEAIVSIGRRIASCSCGALGNRVVKRSVMAWCNAACLALSSEYQRSRACTT